MISDFPNSNAVASNSDPRSFSGKTPMKTPSPSSASAGKEAREDSEIFSDIVLSYISQMLMEEDGDEKIDMLQEHPALLAAEKGFFDIIADSSSSYYSSSSSDHPLPTSIRSYNSSDDSLSPPGRNPNVPDSLADRPDPLEPLPSWFKLPPHYLPNNNTAAATFPAAGALSVHKNTHISVDELEAEQGRIFKQSALNFDAEVLSEMFDSLTLFHDNCKGAKAAENQATANGHRKLHRRKKVAEKRASVDLNSLLLQCSEAVSNNELPRAHSLLNQIRQSSSPFGDSEQRVAHCFSNGLEARLAGSIGSRSYPSQGPAPAMIDMLRAYQLYIAAAPFKKISDFFAHQTLLNAIGTAGKLHIVDFGIYHGFMWPCFMQRLSALPGRPPCLRITAVDVPQPGFRPTERIEDTGRRLTDYARRFGLHFEYHAIACKWEELQLEELRIEEDEVLAVTCMYRLRNLADETMSPESPRDQFLKTVRKLNPKVFVTGIVNGAYNSPFFATRFKEALFHFSALFDMMERNAAKESEERRLLEKHWFEREVVNVVACEGPERVERPETYKQWKSRNERAGLEQLPLDPGIPGKAREKLKSCYHKDFLVGEDGRWMLLGWKGRILCALSAWKSRNV